MTTDRVSASVLVLFALLVIWETRQLPLGTFRQPGPAFIPILLALLLLSLAVFLWLTSGRAPLLSRLAGPSGAMRWRFWQHPSFRFSPLSVLVIVSLSCSWWGFWLNWWSSAVGYCLYRLPAPYLSVRSSFSIRSCGCLCLRVHLGFEAELSLNNDSTRIAQEKGRLNIDLAFLFGCETRIQLVHAIQEETIEVS